MRFLLDENIEARLGFWLADQGHSILRISRDTAPGIADRDVLALARREARILLTNDQDFGNLIFQERLSHSGIVLFRFPPTSPAQHKFEALTHVIASHTDLLARSFVVLTPSGARFR